MVRNLPNFITLLRIIGTLILFFLEPMSIAFYIVYTLAGISDVMDGFVARRWNLTSKFGSSLDSLADLLFYTVMLLRIFPILWELLPMGIWIALGGILVIRALCYLIGTLKYRRFVSIHTYLNKLTGFAVFATPYFIRLPENVSVVLCGTVCAIGAVASVEELAIHLCSKNYRGHVKSILEFSNHQKGVS